MVWQIFGIPLAWRFVPESPHFMIAQGRIEEVEDLVAEVLPRIQSS